MTFKCIHCNKEYKSKQMLNRHNDYSPCAMKVLKERMITLETRNIELEIENETLRNNPVTVNNIDNRQFITNNQQNNVIHVTTQSLDEYFEQIPGLPKIDLTKGYHKNRVERTALELPTRSVEKTDFDYMMNQAFNPNTLKKSVVIRNKREHKCDIKYAGITKPLDEHFDLLKDVKEFGETAISKSIEDHNYKKGHLVQNFMDESNIRKTKRSLCKKAKDNTWRELQKKQVISIEICDNELSDC